MNYSSLGVFVEHVKISKSNPNKLKRFVILVIGFQRYVDEITMDEWLKQNSKAISKKEKKIKVYREYGFQTGSLVKVEPSDMLDLAHYRNSAPNSEETKYSGLQLQLLDYGRFLNSVLDVGFNRTLDVSNNKQTNNSDENMNSEQTLQDNLSEKSVMYYFYCKSFIKEN
ncbi:hypothetical protein RhiirA4_476123 [Rhizophagus irregularis]|uniref:Uncharacterized protein n=1 Tax=Rhizophagus irregularis TaxID=588596 RepID=A0A2I1HB35_9GLOM|nr:hypothetical protein RhiirA4_476123 [Rhizophagus irregularis]